MNKLDAMLMTSAVLVLVATIVAVLTANAALWAHLTRLGDEELYILFVMLAYYLAPSIATRFSIVIAVLLSGSLNIALKYTFNTPRPLNPLVEVEGPGFPSGHAQVSASFWSALFLTWRKRSLLALSTAVVTAVSLSRIYLRAHYVVDVLGGVLFGTLTGILPSALLSARTRTGLLLRSYVLGATTLLLGAYNILYLNVEQGSASVLLGLSIAALLVPPVHYRCLPDSAIVSFIKRISGFAVSATLLVFVHYALLRVFFPLRILGFALGGVASFVLIPVLLARRKK